MGGEKKVLWMRLGRRRHWGMSELGCADGCGWRGCKGVAGNGWGEEVAGDELGCADGCGRRACKECLKMGGEKKVLGMSELGCADGCGRRVCKGVGGNDWGEEAPGDERAWLRGWLRTAWVERGRSRLE